MHDIIYTIALTAIQAEQAERTDGATMALAGAERRVRSDR